MAEVECFLRLLQPVDVFRVSIACWKCAKEIGVTIAFRPHLVGGVFNAVIQP